MPGKFMVYFSVLGFGLVLFFAALCAVFFITPLCITLAHAWGMIDHPDGKAKCHARPTPYLGGLAIFSVMVLPLLAYAPLLFPGLLLLFILGLIDDAKRLPPGILFAGHSLGAICLLISGAVVPAASWGSFLSYGISFFWLVSLINAFNLIDVMDGLATTAALSASVAFCVFLLLMQQANLFYVLSALSGALAGFLMYNKPPARIYLGDAGSLFLGGFLAAISLKIPWQSHSYFHVIIPPLLLVIPLFELMGLVIIRSCKGVPFYRATPDHFSIYLQAKGWKKIEVLCFIFFLSLLTFGISVGWYFHPTHVVAVFTSSMFIFLIWCICLFRM